MAEPTRFGLSLSGSQQFNDTGLEDGKLHFNKKYTLGVEGQVRVHKNIDLFLGYNRGVGDGEASTDPAKFTPATAKSGSTPKDPFGGDLTGEAVNNIDNPNTTIKMESSHRVTAGVGVRLQPSESILIRPFIGGFKQWGDLSGKGSFVKGFDGAQSLKGHDSWGLIAGLEAGWTLSEWVTLSIHGTASYGNSNTTLSVPGSKSDAKTSKDATGVIQFEAGARATFNLGGSIEEKEQPKPVTKIEYREKIPAPDQTCKAEPYVRVSAGIDKDLIEFQGWLKGITEPVKKALGIPADAILTGVRGWYPVLAADGTPSWGDKPQLLISMQDKDQFKEPVILVLIKDVNNPKPEEATPLTQEILQGIIDENTAKIAVSTVIDKARQISSQTLKYIKDKPTNDMVTNFTYFAQELGKKTDLTAAQRKQQIIDKLIKLGVFENNRDNKKALDSIASALSELRTMKMGNVIFELQGTSSFDKGTFEVTEGKIDKSSGTWMLKGTPAKISDGASKGDFIPLDPEKIDKDYLNAMMVTGQKNWTDDKALALKTLVKTRLDYNVHLADNRAKILRAIMTEVLLFKNIQLQAGKYGSFSSDDEKGRPGDSKNQAVLVRPIEDGKALIEDGFLRSLESKIDPPKYRKIWNEGGIGALKTSASDQKFSLQVSILKNANTDPKLADVWTLQTPFFDKKNQPVSEPAVFKTPPYKIAKPTEDIVINTDEVTKLYGTSESLASVLTNVTKLLQADRPDKDELVNALHQLKTYTHALESKLTCLKGATDAFFGNKKKTEVIEAIEKQIATTEELITKIENYIAGTKSARAAKATARTGGDKPPLTFDTSLPVIKKGDVVVKSAKNGFSVKTDGIYLSLANQPVVYYAKVGETEKTFASSATAKLDEGFLSIDSLPDVTADTEIFVLISNKGRVEYWVFTLKKD